MTDGLPWHRIQFAFSVTFHYLFPQLTMGLAVLIVLFKSLALRRGDERYDEVARFWGRIFALNFAMGTVTGIPLEFQFGTNLSRFSQFSGEVVGQALAMEGVFAFFLESTFLGLFLFGEWRLARPWRAITRSGCGRPSTPPTASLRRMPPPPATGWVWRWPGGPSGSCWSPATSPTFFAQ
jgi:cytochrome bd-type quinol oxidase subunit 1